MSNDETRGIGRPSGYNLELCIEICDQVSQGKNIKKVLSEKEEYPTFQTWCNWKRQHIELFDLYVKAIQDKSEAMDEAIDDVMIDLRAGLIEASVANVLIQTLKWKAAKYYPKMFGEKVDLTSDGEKIAPIIWQEVKTYDTDEKADHSS